MPLRPQDGIAKAVLVGEPGIVEHLPGLLRAIPRLTSELEQPKVMRLEFVILDNALPPFPCRGREVSRRLWMSFRAHEVSLKI